MNEVIIKQFPALPSSENELLNIIYGNLMPRLQSRKKLLVTSACNNEGKTHIAMQLARSMASKGHKVVLVDADFRHSQLISSYKITSKQKIYGFEAYLSGACDLEKVIAKTDIPSLYIIPCIEHAADPLTMLDCPALSAVLAKLEEAFDYIILDTASAGLYMDAARIASYCDGAVMVARFNKTRRSDFVESCRRIEDSGCPILGVVMNRVSFLSISARKYFNLLYRTFKTK